MQPNPGLGFGFCTSTGRINGLHQPVCKPAGQGSAPGQARSARHAVNGCWWQDCEQGLAKAAKLRAKAKKALESSRRCMRGSVGYSPNLAMQHQVWTKTFIQRAHRKLAALLANARLQKHASSAVTSALRKAKERLATVDEPVQKAVAHRLKAWQDETHHIRKAHAVFQEALKSLQRVAHVLEQVALPYLLGAVKDGQQQ